MYHHLSSDGDFCDVEPVWGEDVFMVKRSQGTHLIRGGHITLSFMIVVTLAETMKLMTLIDTAIPGFPIE
jgi:hypothetical protein